MVLAGFISIDIAMIAFQKVSIYNVDALLTVIRKVRRVSLPIKFPQILE